MASFRPGTSRKALLPSSSEAGGLTTAVSAGAPLRMLLTAHIGSGMCGHPPIDCARPQASEKRLVQISLPRPPRRDHPQALVRPRRNPRGPRPQERLLTSISSRPCSIPKAPSLLAELTFEALKDDDLDYVGGLEMGAVPLAGAIAQLSWIKGHPIAAFFVRKKPKEHGARLAVEGLAKGESLQGKRVVIVEDVTTTGGSALKAVGSGARRRRQHRAGFHHGGPRRRRHRNLRASRHSLSLALQGRRIFEGMSAFFFPRRSCGSSRR